MKSVKYTSPGHTAPRYGVLDYLLLLIYAPDFTRSLPQSLSTAIPGSTIGTQWTPSY